MIIRARSFLESLLARSGILGHGTGLGRLGRLAAGIGVNLGIHDQDVDIFTLGHDMVQAAVTDIIGPAVTADDPVRLLGEQIAASGDFGEQVIAGCIL
jgi:hypothetical protein